MGLEFRVTMQLYNLNNEFLQLLCDRIQSSIEEATVDWKSDIRAETFIYNVVSMTLSPVLSADTLKELIQRCLFASTHFGGGSVALVWPIGVYSWWFMHSEAAKQMYRGSES